MRAKENNQAAHHRNAADREFQMAKIKTALITVRDKQGVADLAVFLSKHDVELYATTGTCKVLDKAGAAVKDIVEMTGPQDAFGNRLKMMSRTVYFALTVDPENDQEMEALTNAGGKPIDLLISDHLVPKDKIETSGKTKDTKNMDEDRGIGIDCLIEAAAGNKDRVAVITSADQYEDFRKLFVATGGDIPAGELRGYAARAFERLSDYNINKYNNIAREDADKQEKFATPVIFLKYIKHMDLRYGENPHQRATFYRDVRPMGVSLCDLELLKGPHLSYNNLCDLNSALSIALEFEKEGAVIVKHGNPTGVALDKEILKAYCRARDTDKVAAFGATVVVNTQLDKKTARELLNPHIEVLAAPRFTDGALNFLKNESKAALMRVLKINKEKWVKQPGALDIRSVMGGIVVQDTDNILVADSGQIKVSTKRKPTRKQLADLVMAWKVCKHVRSNAIVICKDSRTLGVGAGQMKRLDSLKIALENAGDEAVDAALASDAYLPFRNVIDEAAKHGISSIIEPGGARRDEEIIAACDEHNISLCMSGIRHFRH